MAPSSITSPCMHLNDDVLREIFIHCASDPESNPVYFMLDGRKRSIRELPQFSVSQVCSSWRHIALLTPRLWNNIKIRDSTETNLSIAREYLSRAENLPVSIILSPHRPNQFEVWRSQLTEFLSSYRIRSLTVSSMIPHIHLVLPNLPQRSVADLETLKIVSPCDWHEAQLDLNDARYPKLAIVRIWGAYKISMFNSSLRIFDGEMLSMTIVESWDILSRCPSLEESRLRITRVNGPLSTPQIHLPYLRIMSLHSESERDEIPFSAFIEALTLPVVEELHISHAPLAWSATAFESLAHRSNCFPHLRDLVLANPTSVIDAGHLLALVPSLKSISLCSGYSGISTNNPIYDPLALNGFANGSLAPRLQSLVLGYISNAGLFADMVESRMKNAQTSSIGVPAPFTRVVFNFAHNQGDQYHNLCDRLVKMRQQGIPISVWRYGL